MDELNEIAEVEQQVETLETEVKKFADGLPYWAIYLAEKILSGNAVSDNDIDTSYSFLLEELKLKEETEKSEIEINYNSANAANYKPDLLLTKLENVEGVNALTENQTIDFSSNLTIVYGANGSGKSGYARLLKKAFYSKAGLSALRSSYEALAIFTILGGTVQRFDPQIRMGRLKDIKYEKSLIETVVEKHGEISDLIEGHLPSDNFGIIPSPEILEQQIQDFKNVKEQLKNIQ